MHFKIKIKTCQLVSIKTIIACFERRSISRFPSAIVRVSVVLKRTVVAVIVVVGCGGCSAVVSVVVVGTN